MDGVCLWELQQTAVVRLGRLLPGGSGITRIGAIFSVILFATVVSRRSTTTRSKGARRVGTSLPVPYELIDTFSKTICTQLDCTPTSIMFGDDKHRKDYSKVNLDDFSDDDSYSPSTTSSKKSAQQLMMEQDQGLEMLGQHATRLGEMSMAIHDELGQQNKILTEMDDELDQAGENLDLVTRKTQEFIRMSGGTKNFMIILCMSVTVVILILLILYT